ncbi:MAG: 50S ribosomal protein L11 [Candidatus Aenigmarchaeota archaeon]|nr:50S ribosomal protein L11 [Candidatus Aenigmarchaeota archaeon]
MGKETLDLLIEGGNAKPGPTTAPKLSQYKVNMGQLFNEINEKTKEYKGMNVPVKIVIDTSKSSYEIKVGVPPVSSLIKKELGLKKMGVEKKAEDKIKPATVEEKKPAEVIEKRDAKTPTKTPVEELAPKKEEKKERIIFGNLKMEQIVKITKMKRDSLLAKDFKKAVKEIVGAVVSMPLTIEGKPAKEILKEIDEGKYDSLLK